jgi:hypothetical protein
MAFPIPSFFKFLYPGCSFFHTRSADFSRCLCIKNSQEDFLLFSSFYTLVAPFLTLGRLVSLRVVVLKILRRI